MYYCKRSATVYSKNYATLVKINQRQFNEILRKSPALQMELNKVISFYSDVNKNYIQECLKRLPMFSNLDVEDQNSLIFNFEHANYKKGAMLQKPGEKPEKLMIILKGIAEIYTSIADNDIRIEYLKQGDILNPHQFILRNTARMPIRCVTDVETLELNYNLINFLRQKRDESTLNQEMNSLL